MDNNVVDQTIELLQTPNNFKEWLNTFPKDSAVGLIASSKYCPIATFLVDRGIKDNIVTTTQIIIYDSDEVYILRYVEILQLEWLTKFIEDIDTLNTHFAISQQVLDLLLAT